MKKAVIEAVEAVLPEGAIFASNTSTLPISGLAKNSKRPADFIGIHFFSPVEKMMLTEVILGRTPATRRWPLLSIMSQPSGRRRSSSTTPAASSSIAACSATCRESYDMLIEGVPPVMIENAAKMAGMPVGPLALNDEVAIDLSLKILKATVADLGEKAIDPRHMDLISRMVEKDGPLRPQEFQGLLRLPAETGEEVPLARPQDLLPAEAGG